MWSWAFLFLAIVPEFERDVAPILSANCAGCHAGTAKASGFSVDKLALVMAGGKKHGKAVVGVKAEKRPHQYEVSRRRNREELGETLDESQKRKLTEIHDLDWTFTVVV